MQRTFGLKGVNKMSNIISYNSWENKAPFGAIKINQGVRISVEGNESYDLVNIKWIILKDENKIGEVDLIRESKKYYRGEFNGFNETGLYFYYFEVDINIDGNNIRTTHHNNIAPKGIDKVQIIHNLIYSYLHSNTGEQRCKQKQVSDQVIPRKLKSVKNVSKLCTDEHRSH